VHEKLVRPEHVAAEQIAASLARATARALALIALLTLTGALELAHLLELGAQAVTLGTPLGAQALALDTLARARFALGEARLEPGLSRCFAPRALRVFRSHLGGPAPRSHVASHTGELLFYDLTGYPKQASDQSVDQTTGLTLEMIHLVSFRVSHGTTAFVKRAAAPKSGAF
jgi:hypothetical protein